MLILFIYYLDEIVTPHFLSTDNW